MKLLGGHKGEEGGAELAGRPCRLEKAKARLHLEGLEPEAQAPEAPA